MLSALLIAGHLCVGQAYPRQADELFEMAHDLQLSKPATYQLLQDQLELEAAEDQLDPVRLHPAESAKAQKMKLAGGQHAPKKAHADGKSPDEKKAAFMTLPKFLSFGMGYPYWNGPPSHHGHHGGHSPCYRPPAPRSKCGCAKSSCCDTPAFLDEEEDAPLDYLDFRRRRRYRMKPKPSAGDELDARDELGELNKVPANVELIKKTHKLNKEKREQDFDYWYNARMGEMKRARQEEKAAKQKL